MAQTKSTSAPRIGVQATALVTASFLSGAMVSLSAVGVPVFLDTNTESSQLLRQWARLYHYGHIYMPAVAIAATSLYAYVALSQRAANREQWRRYAAAAVTTITMVPFTWLVMAPTNDVLFGLKELAEATASTVNLSMVQGLVTKWAWMHIARSVFPLVGSIMGLASVFSELGL